MSSYRFADVATEIQYHLGGIFAGFKFKALVASVPALFSSVLGGDFHFFEAWFALNIVDLVLGVVLAYKTAEFTRARLHGWVVKTLTHMGTILLFGVVTVLFHKLTGNPAPMLDGFLFVLVLTESVSILDSADMLGLPVHPLLKAIVVRLRRRTEAKLKAIAGGKETEAAKEKETDLL